MGSSTNLSDAIIPKLENMISGMSPGERLPTEMQLAKQFSVGRSTIRESLKILAYKKLIVRKKEGTFVAESAPGALDGQLKIALDLDVANLTELLELREILETAIIRLAVKRATDEDILEIERINWRMTEPGVPAEELQKRDIEFHEYIAGATGNETLAMLAGVVRQLVTASIEEPVLPAEVFKESADFHSDIIRTLKERDEEAAALTMAEYLMRMDYES